jgi:hypothetical protein
MSCQLNQEIRCYPKLLLLVMAALISFQKQNQLKMNDNIDNIGLTLIIEISAHEVEYYQEKCKF